MFGRVATEVNTVKIRPMGQMIWRFILVMGTGAEVNPKVWTD
jgi:hypothetical protein